MKTILNFLRLDGTERRFFATALVSMAAIRLALNLWSFQRVIGATDAINLRWPRRRSAAPSLPRAAKRIAQAARLCGGASTCLSEAIAGRFLMARIGYPAELRIGVRKAEGKFEAHAWLECAGDLVIGNPSPAGKQYSRMPSLGRFFA
jgi:hypothetical protein